MSVIGKIWSSLNVRMSSKLQLFLGSLLVVIVLSIAWQQPNKELFGSCGAVKEGFKANACSESRRSLPLADFSADFAKTTPDFRIPAQ